MTGLVAAVTVAVLVGARLWPEPPSSVARAPNVLLIGIDSLRRDRLDRDDVTPTLRRLMSDPQAVTFRDHWVGIPRTFPSWLEILQGRYAARTGIRHMFPGFRPRQGEFKGIVSEVRDAGYRTLAISDFAGDIFPRFAAGFETVEAPKLTLHTMIRMSVDQLFPAFLPFVVSKAGVALFPALKESPAFADPAHLVDQTLSELGRPDGRPTFLTLFFSTAHFPYAAPHPYYSRFSSSAYAGPFRFQKNPDLSTTKVAIDAVETAQVRALFDGSVNAIDGEIARLFAALKASGAWERTLIVVTADHGEDLFETGVLQGHGEHLRGENVLRVPLIVKLPGRSPPVLRDVGFATRSIDLAPTLAGALGMPRDGYDGVDLSPWLRGEKTADPASPVYAETGLWFARSGDGFFQKKRLDYPGIAGLLSFDQGFSGEIVLNADYESRVVAAKHRMLIEGDYKLIYMPMAAGVAYELYDRRADPANAVDLATTKPDVLARMKKDLLDFVAKQESLYRVTNDYVVPK